MVSLQSNRTLTKTKVGTRDWGIAVTGLAMLFVEEIGKTLGLWTRKTVGCFNEDFGGHISRSIENNS